VKARFVARVFAVIMALATVGVGTGVAQAHPTLLFTEPAAQTAVAESPVVITLLFNEPVTVGDRAIVLLGDDGRPLPTGPVTLERDGRFVTVQPEQPLAPGTYAVRWRVTGGDGDLVEQEFRFAVGKAVQAVAPEAGSPPAWGTAILRWLLFIGLALAIGSVIAGRFTQTARDELPTLPALRSWLPAASALALTGSAGLVVQRVVDAGDIAAAWDGRAGALLLIELAALVAALAAVRLGRWALVPLAVVVVAEGIRSHAGTSDGAVGALLTGVHLAAICVWVGALVYTVRAVWAWRHVDGAVRWVLAHYIRLALWTYIAVVTSGVISALVIVPLSQLTSTTYGRVLLVKLGLVAAASAAALAARVFVRDPSRISAARPIMRVEAGLLAVVVAASAVLASTAPPAIAAQAAPPPQPTGPVLPLGALAGQVGISVAASDDLLVVRLSTPRQGDYYARESDQEYRLSAALGDSPLRLTGCGTACYYAAATWHAGDNVLTLRAEATGWHGGTAALLVPWPPRPGQEDLAKAVETTRAAGSVAVYETVTSDTSTTAPEPNRLELDTDFFLSQEPYADGTGPWAVRVSPDGAPVRLALGYPAASIDVLLGLDENGRISDETLTDPKHLVTRRFVYSDGG
jgi:copper transport protein